jgi:hypothetical protein
MRRGRYLRVFLTGVGFILILLGLTSAGASSANISHSYQASTIIKNGSVVSLDPKRSNYVVPANTTNGGQLLGVVVVGNDSLIAVDPNLPGRVQVATNGSATTLVSTLNGDIHVGDQIGISPFDGVGIKALPGSRVIGLAQTAFNADTPGATSKQITDKKGASSSVEVGYTQINIAIGTNATVLSAGNLNSLQKAAKTLTGHTVSTARVAISLAVALVALLALVTLIYASIYSSIVSIGRNPLAKYAVFRTLSSVLGLALLTATVACVTIFFLLK